MFCVKCGNQIDDDALFCPMCGTKVKQNDNNASETNSTIQNDNDKETVKLNKVEPKQIKPATEEEKKQNAAEVKGMFFKKHEVSQELIDELNEAEKNSDKDTSVTQDATEPAKHEKKDSVLKKAMGKMSDKDLDKPVYKTKYVLVASIALIVMVIGTIVAVSGINIRTNANYSENVLEDAGKYVKYEIKEEKKKDNKKNGWEGDTYFRDGKKVKNEWAEYQKGDGTSDWYYLDKNGNIVRSDWVEDPLNSNKWYYVDSAGIMLKDKYEYVDGVVYYFQSDGLLLTNGYTPDGQHQMGPDGKPIY